MQVVKMELRGFKSFADKTVLTFDRGITAIVGPNGSGKSNISDAVRWVLGEQNVRQLRGQKAEDVIFSGTAQRRSQGVAEVSLYFDNQDNTLDIAFSEVVITRRLFRSGESEFYINKRPCRLKDIHRLFADTGMGQDSMAVIEQNRVDRILNSKPDERRIIFEEVAGISRFKGRKQDGLRKLAETERNLERVGDLMSVLAERLVPLAKEAATLQQFRSLDAERRAYEGTLTLQALRNSERLLAKFEYSLQEVVTEVRETRQDVALLEEKRQAALQQMAGAEQQAQQLDEAVLRVHNERDRLVQRRQACIQRQEELASSLQSLEEEQHLWQQKKDRLTALQAAQERQAAQRQKELDAARQRLALTQALFGKAEEKAQQTAAALAEVLADRQQQEQARLLAERDIQEWQRRLSENEKSGCQLQQDYEQARRRLQEAGTEKKEAEHRLQVWEHRQQEARIQYDRQEAALEKQRQACQRVRQDRQRRQEIETTAKQRLRVVQAMIQAHEGAGRAAKTILTATQVPWRAAVCGMAGELCSFPAAYAAAVEAALGGAAKYIVMEEEEAAKSAIAYLRKKQAGRTTFLPLSTVKIRPRTPEELQAAEAAGILGFASDLIQYEAKYTPIFRALLGRTLVAKTVDAASAAAHTFGHRVRIVCLDGTLFNPGGSLTGGSLTGKEASFMGRRVLLRELQAQVQQAETEAAAQQALWERLQRQEKELQAQWETQKQRLQEGEVQRQQACWQAERWREEENRRQQQAETLATRQKAQQQERVSLQAALVQKQERSASLTALSPEEEPALLKKRQEAAAEAERCRRLLTEGQVATATLQEQVRQAQLQVQQWRQQVQEHEATVAALREKEAQLRKKQEETATLYRECTAGVAAKEAEVKQKDAEKEAFYSSRKELFQRSREWERQSTALRERLQSSEERRHRNEMQVEKYSTECRHYEERLALQGLTRQEAMAERRAGSLKELQQHVESYQQRIAALGTINPAAAEAYEAAQKQQVFYEQQCADLREAQGNLQTVVQDIDTAMAKQFTQAFTAVRQHFQTIFARLFGGGTAELVLTDKKQVLQAGVEIFICPPGKKQQPLTLLSGGERSLTVIALLLAFSAYRPAPFCVFDEVDAALDEANVERMAKYLKNYSGQTQFIVITHRRKTMEAATVLQGVTMEEKGVSRLVTVKVAEIMEEGT